MTLRKIRGQVTAGLLAGVTMITGAQAHDPAAPERGAELFKGATETVAGAGVPTGRPPLYQGLGDLTMPITTGNATAQAYFDQGMVLAWAFNHAEARRSFQAAQQLDSNCAMCFWGEAFVLGPNINYGMTDDAIAPAVAAIRRAEALKATASAKERALIEALSRRYSDDAGTERAALDAAWADALRGVAQHYPEDAHILTLFAEALMNLQPWDYWEADGLTPKGHGREIAITLKQALECNPDHPGAAHLFIHAVEASAHPEDAEAVADRLRGAVPAAGHLVHMPAHIYTRIGRYGDSMVVNRHAIAADESFLQQAGAAASPLYRYGYYPHNVHFLMVSAQMAGVAQDVIASADKLAAITSDELSQELAWVQAMETAPYTAHAQFSDPATVLALPDPGDRFPFVKGFWHYARGVAHAAGGDPVAAKAELRNLARIIDQGHLDDLEAQYVPARAILGIAKHVLEARIEQSRRDYAAAEHHLREAIALEDGMPYMEPPFWYYPVRQTLGAVLLQQGRAADAAAVFQEALQKAPRSGWVLWGLMQAQAAAGDKAAAATQTAFERAWHGDRALLTLDRL